VTRPSGRAGATLRQRNPEVPNPCRSTTGRSPNPYRSTWTAPGPIGIRTRATCPRVQCTA